MPILGYEGAKKNIVLGLPIILLGDMIDWSVITANMWVKKLQVAFCTITIEK